MTENPEQRELDVLVNSLYGDLHRIAVRHLRGERSDHTLQPTALLHEAYVKLSNDGQRRFNDRTHFMAIASRVMRQVLVDYARSRATLKRDMGVREEIEDGEQFESLQIAANRKADPIDILELNRVLDALHTHDEALARLIEMRYFGGMTAEETAQVLGQSPHIVRHDIRLAQAWLLRELRR